MNLHTYAAYAIRTEETSVELPELRYSDCPTVEVAVAKGETQAVAELAQVPGRELGMVDPARMTETIDVVKSVFTLKNPVSVDDVYAPGFVGKGS